MPLSVSDSIFMTELLHSDIAKIRAKIENGNPPPWERLIIELIDKGIVSEMNNMTRDVLVDDCKYPQAAQVGQFFFNKLKTQCPDLTVEQLMAGCQEIQRNDVCQRLEDHFSTCQQQQQQLVVGLPPPFRKDLEKMIGFSHYSEFPGCWKILAEVSR